MSSLAIKKFKSIKDFPALVEYLGDELDWPIVTDNFEEMTFEYSAAELGLDDRTAPKFIDIRRLRPLDKDQPWGIFFIRFDQKKLPVVALRRLLSKLVINKRSLGNSGNRASWHESDLLLISQTGELGTESISFAHFASNPEKTDLPILKVLGWDDDDTGLKIDYVIETLKEKLVWPEDPSDSNAWRTQWQEAFTLKNREVIHTSKDMAIRLGQLALAVRTRLREVLAIESDEGPIHKLMLVFKENLISDLDTDSFSDMYAQTIAYGLLSARIINPKANTADAAHTQIPITNPFLRDLMETFLNVGGRSHSSGIRLDFDELGINEVVNLLDNTNMEAVIRDFGDRNQKEDPVMHFFEGFLQEYDSKIRKDRGVFYTPQPVVSFIVRSVDEQLRTEFGLKDGLADTTTWGELAKRTTDLKIPEEVSPDQAFVQILDPATGTGTFPVEVIDIIYKTMTTKWKSQGNQDTQIKELWNEYVPKYLLSRLHGYELMMAPYAIAHMKIGLKLNETGYKFNSNERARIYLTNALEPPQNSSGKFTFAIPALAREAEAVKSIKLNQKFTVVIGNPPYSGHSSNNQIQWIVEKVRDYVEGISGLNRPAQGKWLQDDYVKFIRFGQSLVSFSNAGVLCYITNHNYLDNPTFRGMRKSIFETFNQIDCVDLHGNLTRREQCPDGTPDQNVFEIRTGVSCGLFSRFPGKNYVYYRNIWGIQSEKYAVLQESTTSSLPRDQIQPEADFYLFVPQNKDLAEEYQQYRSLPDIFNRNGSPAPGVVTTHDEFAISSSKEEAIAKVKTFLKTQSEIEARGLFKLCGTSQWNYDKAKLELEKGDWHSSVGQITYRPFDVRWTVYNSNVAVHQRLRATRHFFGQKNLGICVGKAGQVTGSGSWNLVTCTSNPVDFNLFYRGGACNFPLYLEFTDASFDFKLMNRQTNFSEVFLTDLANCLDTDLDHNGGFLTGYLPEDFLEYCFAILHSPTYRNRYGEFLRIDYPRIPLPKQAIFFAALAKLGQKLMSYQLMRGDLPDSTMLAHHCEGTEVEKVSYSDKTVWTDKLKTRGFKDVPTEVWNFQIGGYQVCEKWLKDRAPKKGNPGRILTKDDITHYQNIIFSVRETIRIMNEIDEVVDIHGGWPNAFVMNDF